MVATINIHSIQGIGRLLFGKKELGWFFTRVDIEMGWIIRAITLYCKAEFGFNNAAEQFRKSYDALKMRLSLSAEYNTAPQVSETDTNSTESGV